ncbi:flippase [Thermococcus thermotolerans]|uniref:flippase n=1 Tax=Thermococcus thermotolerans TaxID=2969672 RepID=UPI0021583464|nr:flippase [Thermococcus thermotolerans]
MSEASQALQRIARGTGILFAGTVISMFFGFLSRAIIAREFSREEYGVFNLALTVLSIALVVATLGFQNALPREIAFYRERKPSKVTTLISTAITLSILTGLATAVLVFASADKVALLLQDERLSYAIRIGVLALPFWALTAVMISVSRGFGRVREQVYFQNVVYPAVFLIIITGVAVSDSGFQTVFTAYVLSWAATFALLIADIRKTGLIEFRPGIDPRIGREIVVFSLPLLFSGILAFVMNWTDTLMLGYYWGSDTVGLYNAAAPLARLIPIFLNSAGFLYAPLVAGFWALGKLSEMKRVYQILTKWIFLLTLPIFSLLFLFPEPAIAFFFGQKYVQAAPALQILSLGFMFHTFLGLNGMSLVVIGEPNLNMVGNVFAAGFNILLNVLLIPAYGIEGAAVATAVSYFVANVFRSVWLYRKTGIHPFSQNYLKPLGIGLILLGTLKVIPLKVSSIWYAVPVLAVFLAVYFLLVLLSGSVDREDVELFLAIEKKLGIDLKWVKKVLGRFVH